MRSKLWISLCTVLLVVFVVGSYGVQAEETLTIAVGAHPAVDAMKEVIPEFEAKTGINVRLDEMDPLRLYDKEIVELSQGSGSYDVIMMDVCWLGEYAKKDLIVPLSERYEDELYNSDYDIDDLVQPYLTGLCTWEDTVYSLPLTGETTTLAYRQDLFEKYDKTPPKTMEELMELAEFFDDKESGLNGISMRGKRGHSIVYAYFQFLWAFGGRPVDDNYRPTINSEEAVKALEYYVDLMEYAPIGQESFTYEEATSAFQQGTVAMYADATNCSFLEDPDASVIAGDIGYGLMPKNADVDHWTAIAGWSLAIPKNSELQDEAFEFISFVTNKENDVNMANAGNMPVRNSTFTDPEMIEKYPYYEEVLNIIKKGVPEFRPRIPEWPEMSETIGLAASEVLTGEKSAKDALDGAQEKLEELLEDYYK